MKTGGVVQSGIQQIDTYSFLCLYFYWTAIWVEDFIQIVNNLFEPAGSDNQKCQAVELSSVLVGTSTTA
jgi:hypothetical protein